MKGKSPVLDIQKVNQAIEDHIFELHRFPDITTIMEITKLGRHRCDTAIREMMRKNELTIAFEAKGKPTIYVPTPLMQEILRFQPKPNWLNNYEFTEKQKLISELETTRSQIHDFEIFERLLYATGQPLEEAVAAALKYLGFKSIVYYSPTNSDYADITFNFKGTKYLVEVKGVSSQADKSTVLQLEGWIRVEMDQSGADPETIAGLLVVNHFRHEDPKSRKDPVTNHAARYLKRYNFKVITTSSLFTMIKNTYRGQINKKIAQAQLLR